jgi:hypothetical protein
MSSDLLAEFDSFYNPPQDGQSRNATLASNDLSFLNGTNGHIKAPQVQSGDFQRWQNQPEKPTGDIWGNMTSFQTNAQPAPIAQDIWGSFEAAANPSKNQVQPPTATTPNYGGYRGDTNSASQQRNASSSKPSMPRRSTIELFSSNFNPSGPVQNATRLERNHPQIQAAPTKGSYGEVLFDADDMAEEPVDDDEFGEFESVAPEPVPHAQPPPPPSQSLDAMFGATTLGSKTPKRPANLLSTSTMKGMLPYPQAPKSPSFQERNPFADLGLSTKPISDLQKEKNPESTSPVTAWPTFEPKHPKPDPYEDSPAPNNQVDDEWGDFVDLPPESHSQQSAKAAVSIEEDAWGWDTVDQITETTYKIDAAPPTNIPPPSVLLALFPSIFDLPQSALFKPVANQPFSLKNRIMSDPSTIEFLRAYLLIATVAARIIAGRKLRWKRDTLLSQAMKIGQAAAGGKGGMKLTGVDKAETTREDREATEVVRVWKEQLGRLRSAVAVANSSIQKTSLYLAIPDVSEALHVKTQERGLSAPKPCLICGLKREERVNKVDNDVEDSFGEWWVDHWGHRACRNFWLEHEASLRNR